MKSFARSSAFTPSYPWTCFVAALIAVLMGFPTIVKAQRSTASINGTVRDPSGGVIPGAAVTLINTQTTGRQTAITNEAGDYVILNITPGKYQLQAAKEGFTTATQADLSLDVNQTATFDFNLQLGSTSQTVKVEATAALVQASTAELGTAITTQSVNDLPLNGRNFTELLSLTPGVSPVSVSQNSGGGGGFVGNAVGTFTFPSVNGQSNRSNLFLLDGINDLGSFVGTYAVAPVVDGIQEFKVQSHNDIAEFGGSLGGIINTVTKSGTNAFHGSAWEFLRNNALDARNFFLADVTPFRQNQFGGAVGGPVILPHIYNGRNKTFFFASYQGFRNHTANQNVFLTATPQQLNGDFSGLVNSSGQPIPIYNPFSTRPDPNHPGQFIRDPFPNNQIPANLINQGMLTYAKALFPAPTVTGVAGSNAVNTTPAIIRQDDASLRFDHQFNERNSLWIRYSGFTQPDTPYQAGGIPAVSSDVFYHGYQAAVQYSRVFSSSSVASFEFGRNSIQDNIIAVYNNAPANLWQQAGFSPNFAGGFAGGNGPFNPGIGINGYLSFATGNEVQDTRVADVYEFKGDFSKIHGRHTLKMGADFSSNNTQSPIFGVSDGFSAFQTSNPESPGGTGDALASYLLGVPDNAGRRNVFETEHGGWVDGFYFQDSWKATEKLTVNLGFRYDVTLVPIYGRSADASNQVGDMDFTRGVYILAANAPPCSATQGAPCIPGGQLPANVMLTPFTNHAIIHNTYDNWQPRVGLAYRWRPNTVLRASYGRFFDNWAAVIQTAQNYEGAWPSIGQLLASNLNNPIPGSPTPTVTAQDPFKLGTAPPLPAATPFQSTGFVQWYMDPRLQNPYSDQWNFGVQQQIKTNTVLTANYVGSHSSRLDVGGFYNVALTPGPGNPTARALFPFSPPSYYDRSWGRGNYNAFQFSLDRKTSGGLAYLISYTWSKSEDIGCSGWYGVEGCSIQNPYNLDQNKSVSGFDLTHILSASWVYQIPFGRGQRWSSDNRVLNYALGNWGLNGILFLSSGQPYDVGISGDIANTGMAGCCAGYYERLDEVSNPNLANRDPSLWLSKSSFAVPAPFTFGTLGRNTLRSDWNRSLDFSIFRQFPVTESKRFEFRFEAFNLFNTPIFGIPTQDYNSPNFGRVFSTVNTARQLQFGLKFYF
jgi:outer membrane receptor protein involved in Fe transport